LIFVTGVFLFLAYLLAIIEFYSLDHLLKASIWMSINLFLIVYTVVNSYIVVAFMYFIQLYINLKAQKVNESMKTFETNSHTNISIITNSFLVEHNQICLEIHNINKFWKKLYSNFVYTMIPFNLLALHQIIFEDLKLHVQITFGIIVIVQFFLYFGFNSISHQFLHLCTNLLSFYLEFSGRSMDGLFV